ncbi:MAG: putative Rossmann fold flavoprotein [Bacteroidia bacterium]
MSKVLISGGGRCNVTNTVWKPEELIHHYPRGHKHLLEPFKAFNSKHTQEWFEERGVQLKTEVDGRVFPITNDSHTIANALIDETKQLGIEIQYSQRAISFEQNGNGWLIKTKTDDHLTDSLVIATGGSQAIWKSLEELGFVTVPPVPSLFTFHCKHSILNDLPGISFPNATVSLYKKEVSQSGPILITHEGISGPATLKLSAWAARELYDDNYNFEVVVNWLGVNKQTFNYAIKTEQEVNPKKHVLNKPVLDIPKRFWTRICELSGITSNRNYAEIGKNQIQKMSDYLLASKLQITGKSTNKDEFVTAGGVDLSEIDFTSFSAKRFPNMYLAGEVLDIDAVTGGFNFQAAWTGGYLIGKNIRF